MSGPRACVVVGGAEFWRIDLRADAISVDRTLRRASSDFWTSGHRAARGKLERTACPFGWYAELELDFSGSSVTDMQLGLLKSSSVAVTSDLSANADAVVISGASGGSIYVAGSSVQSSVGSINGGDRFGVELYSAGGTAYVQFVKNGTNYGTAVAVDGVAWSLVFVASATGRAVVLRVDQNEQKHRPADRQPWGAAAMVSGVAGYSPASSVFTTAGTALTLAGGGKTVSASASGDSAIVDRRGDKSVRWRYFEVLVENNASGCRFGLTGPDHDADTRIGDGGADGWAYDTDGELWNDGNTGSPGVTADSGDFVGIIWDSTDGKLWFTVNGGLVSGDPEAGTGASFTGVLDSVFGYLVPAVSPVSGDRVRLCTHRLEQCYRPDYCEAWDGDDLLPERHFVGRLAGAPVVRQSISFAQWADDSLAVAPIGALELGNTDGGFDMLSEFELRDEPVVAWYVAPDQRSAREWTGVVETVEHPDADVCRVVVASVLAKLDVRIDSPIFALGEPEVVPTVSREGPNITKDVCQTSNCAFQVIDGGSWVGSWTRDDTAEAAGFTRTVGSPGKMAARGLSVFRKVQQIAVSNSDFSAWSGTPPSETPDDWTVNGTGDMAGARDGDAIELTGTSGNIRVWQAGSFDASKFYAVRVRFSEWSTTSSHSITARFYDSAVSTTVKASATLAATGSREGNLGEFVAYITPDSWITGTSASGFAVYCVFNGTVEISSIEVFEARPTAELEGALGYLIEDLGGFAASSWAYFEPDYASNRYWIPGRVGLYSSERPPIRQVLAATLRSEFCDAYPDEHGVIRLAWMLPANEFSDGDDEFLGEIVERDVRSDLTVEDDLAPKLSDRIEYRRNFDPHSDDQIDGVVDDEVRQYLTAERLELTLDFDTAHAYSASPYHPFYSFAFGAPALERLNVRVYDDTNNPLGGGDNRFILLHRCYARRRRFARFLITREKARALRLRPGGIVKLTHRRYGFDAGRELQIVEVEKDVTAPLVGVKGWG